MATSSAVAKKGYDINIFSLTTNNHVEGEARMPRAAAVSEVEDYKRLLRRNRLLLPNNRHEGAIVTMLKKQREKRSW